MLKIFDTLQKQKINLDLQKKQKVQIYSCGPTVYQEIHIGNLRSFICADLLVRTLKANNFQVDWVMNITDIDDKTIKGALSEYGHNARVSELKTYTQRYTEKFLANLREVGINTEQIRFVNVTDTIPQIQQFIIDLLEKGVAYKADDGSTYFNIEKYQAQYGDYGALVGQKFLEGKKVGARIKNDEYDKENLSDFALWKAWDEADGQIYWDHLMLGKGRPGWHIECSAINRLAFEGSPTDIHTGGIDLVFPHHTNEIAQSQPIYKPFVKYWMHNEHLLIDGKKMAKSSKNDYQLSELSAKGFSGLDLRYFFLQSNFHQQTNFTWEALTAAKTSRKKLQQAYTETDSKPDKDFLKALNDNLNTAEALAIAHQNKQNLSSYEPVLGLGLKPQTILEISEELQKLLDARKLARESKDFVESDRLRGEIAKLGYEVLDTKQGQKVQKSK